ncbi:Pimeloyl-ACP methyl ester carboxylesterase [Marinactinospora thermotolerans DSM 45154]|uniref:Pimeloyl-ACP methyl ester carboxylesterase n=1 Tax=Marinactinospora thermotolerans DSM 45154 TaxID=1122192 RepID=A0A1T4R2S6_9ACTN|nr:alpha/beta fold hydrolase [Marinactinospora thermotolerans]SKA10320.1 Pimeloyl-ACP methyl ester carboxylesterase [Marinactinospora thermotolerans DSM 45154]
MIPTADALVCGFGPGLLLAHGAGSDIQDSYGPLIAPLALGNTVVGPDYPGSGGTPAPSGPPTLDALADHIVESALRAGVETFAVSGFSMGTAVAVRTATRHPARVTALVLSAGLARPDIRLRLAVGTWRALLGSGDARGLASYLTLLVNSPAWLRGRSEAEVEEQLALFAEGMPPGTDGQLDLLSRLDVRGDLGRVGVPTLVVSPVDDLLVPPEHSRELAEGIPGAELVELDCGHAIAAERPAEWAALIGDFLTATGHRTPHPE